MDILEINAEPSEIYELQEQNVPSASINDIGAILSVECIVAQLYPGVDRERNKASIPVEVAFVDLMAPNEHSRYLRYSLDANRKVFNYRNLSIYHFNGSIPECGTAFSNICDLIDEFRERTNNTKKIAYAGYSDFYAKLKDRKKDILLDIGSVDTQDAYPGTAMFLKQSYLNGRNLYELLIDSKGTKHCRNHQEFLRYKMGNYEVACVKLHILAIVLWINKKSGVKMNCNSIIEQFYLLPAFEM